MVVMCCVLVWLCAGHQEAREQQGGGGQVAAALHVVRLDRLPHPGTHEEGH